MLKLMRDLGWAAPPATAVSLLSFGPDGAPRFAPDVCAAVAAARMRIAIVGVARGGKSTFINLLCSRLARKDFAPFASAAGTSHVTVGVTAAFVDDVAVLDCQGIRMGDGTLDKALLLVCYYFADIVVYNQATVLDNTIFGNLTQMAAFVALTERGRCAQPALFVRLRDFTGEVAEFDERAELERFLSPAYKDENASMRSAFAKLFQSVEVVCTDMVNRVELALAASRPTEFLERQGSFLVAIGRILEKARVPKTGLSAEALREMLNENVGLNLHDLDALNSGMELAMRRFIDEARAGLAAPVAAGRPALAERLAAVTERLAAFDQQYARVNDVTYRAQRAAICGVVLPPLHAAWKLVLDEAFAAAGATRTDAGGWQVASVVTWTPTGEKMELVAAGTELAALQRLGVCVTALGAIAADFGPQLAALREEGAGKILAAGNDIRGMRDDEALLITRARSRAIAYFKQRVCDFAKKQAAVFTTSDAELCDLSDGISPNIATVINSLRVKVRKIHPYTRDYRMCTSFHYYFDSTSAAPMFRTNMTWKCHGCYDTEPAPGLITIDPKDETLGLQTLIQETRRSALTDKLLIFRITADKQDHSVASNIAQRSTAISGLHGPRSFDLMRPQERIRVSPSTVQPSKGQMPATMQA